MSRPNPKKLSTQPQPGAGLFAAFANLELDGLPAGLEPELAPHLDPSAPPPKLGRVVLRRETAHRGGKCVIVVDGFAPELNAAYIEALGKRLRAACGCGGSVQDRTLEIQGNQPDRVRKFLVAEGFRVAGVA